MAGIHNTEETASGISAASDVQTNRIIESVKDLSIVNCSKNQKKSGATKKKKQTASTSKGKEIQRPSSQASYRNKKYNLPFQKSDDTTVKSSVNRLSSSDPSGDALLRKSITGDQYRGIRHSSSSSPSQSSETAKFGAVRRKNRRGSDSCPEKGYLLPYGLRVQHAAHKCMWSGSESGSATSPAGSSSQPSGEYIAEEVTTPKTSAPPESRKGSEFHFHGIAQKKAHKSSKKEFKFEAYMPLCEVQQSLKKGELIEGVLRINPRNYEDAYISAPDGQMDIYIGGILDRNRALNGDVVAVQLKAPEGWKILWDDLRDCLERNCSVISNLNDAENDQKEFSTILSFLENSQEMNVASDLWYNSSMKNKIATMDMFEIGVFNEESSQRNESTENEQKDYTVKKKRRRKNRKNRLKQQMKESTNDEKEMKCNDIVMDLDDTNCINEDTEVLAFSDTVPKDNNKVFHCIPSETVSDRNCCSSTSFNSHILHNILCEQKLEDHVELTVTASHSKDIETIDDKLTNKEWESDKQNNELIIMPDHIPYFESYDSFSSHTASDTIVEEDSQSEKVCSIAVAPDELSGDEFSQSVSGDSTCSHHLDQLQEDKVFLSYQQDLCNNNNNSDDIHAHAESELHEDETNIQNVATELHCKSTGNRASVETTINSDNRLQYSDASSSSLISLNFAVTCNNVLPDVKVKSEELANKWNSNEEDKQDNYENDIPSFESSTSVKELCTVGHENIKQSSKHSRKGIQKQNLYQLKNKCESKVKQKLAFISELMNHPLGKKFIQRTAKVVHILEKKHTRMAAGSLKLLQDRNSNWVLFSPTDHRLPRLFIPARDCPPGFLKRSEDFSNFLFLAKIVEWTEDSKFAKGNLIQKLGETGEIDAETHGILLENGVDTKEFDEDALKDLPTGSEWHIPYDEIKNRRDFREECVFTIDPATARDLDDAVSCQTLEDGKTFEVGVHIADVTYFIKDGTVLDNIASERATSVYLVQNVIPMLPQVLCEKLCSLNPSEDRLSFSVVWKITSEGEILEEWFGRSIICSSVKLSYEDAQTIIENPEKEFNPDTFPHINGKFTLKDITERVVALNSLAQKLRQKRFKGGALRLDQIKLQFCLDKESGLPSGFSIYEHRDSNRLIEEFMLLANMAVAHKIYKSFPDQALLRCHPQPEKKLMNDVVTTCQAMGMKLDASTSGTLQTSLAALSGEDMYSKARNLVLTALCSKPMKCAQYFSSGTINEPMDCHHYALNVPLYTHFTSPIRRYPDIIVHRLLAASLDNTPTIYSSKPLQKLANHCNDKKYTAKRVNELSSELFLMAFIRECGPIDDQAMVMGVMDHSFDVLILGIGLVKRIYCDKLNLKSKHYQKEKGIPQLLLQWNQGNELVQEIKMFTMVDVTVSVQQTDFMKINVILRYPEGV